MRRPFSLVILVAAAGFAAAGFAATAAPQKSPAAATAPPGVDVKSWTLPNGMDVLFLEDHKAPIATVYVVYHVGSKNERPGIRGIAHMFEHMMFKGSEHVPPEEHARLLKEVGGESNAFTTEDITAYHQTVPPSYVAFAMRLEADRMRQLKLFPATVDSERQVVMEEKRLRVDNNPVGKALELFRQTAFDEHPYRWTAIGTMEDLTRITVADCQKFYDTHYVPNNATLIVAGDITEAEVRRLADQHFGPIARGPAPPRPSAQQKPQAARRDKTLAIKVELPVVIGGYHIPPAGHADVAPLGVLSAILSAGESSRLHQRLVRRERLALGAGGVAQELEHPGLFLVFAIHLPDKDQARIREILLEEVARVRTEKVAPAELEKAKNQLAANYVYGLETVDGIAGQLATAKYVEGDWRRFLDGANRYLAVTAEDIQRVAARYLIDTNLTVVNVVPAKANGAGGNR